MNYSDYDSDGYSSNEDEDYVPSDDNLSEDDMNECEKEEGFDAEDSGKQRSVDVKTKKKKQCVKGIGVRKRKKGGPRLEGEEEDGGTQQEGAQEKQEEEDDVDDACATGEINKKKADDLWASFLSDVGPRPKLSASTSASVPKSPQASDPDKKAVTPSQPHEPEPKPKEPSKITITKVFDFAGEEVRVSKEVESDSKEAKNFLKMQEKEKEKEHEQRPPQRQALSPGPSVKRPAGMGSILSQLSGKKQKMSTLEKSRLDWDAFKSEEGIGDELATHNRGKEGYIERKNFLERVDLRQFEQEKNVRISNMKR